MTTRYIIDIPSNRVIFFTEDDTVVLRAGEEAIVYEDLQPPPKDMTLGNAWSWKLYGRDFKRMEFPKTPPPAKTDIDTLNENKRDDFHLFLYNFCTKQTRMNENKRDNLVHSCLIDH